MSREGSSRSSSKHRTKASTTKSSSKTSRKQPSRLAQASRANAALARSPVIVGPVSLPELAYAPTHPGVVFRHNHREPAGLSLAEAARRLGLTTRHLNEVEQTRRAVTPRTALLFAAFTRTSPEFWMNLQTRRDLWLELKTLGPIGVKPLY